MANRNTLLNAMVEEAIVNAMRAGATVREAAGAAGVGWRTVYDWLQRGERYERALDNDLTPNDADEPFYEFRQHVERARNQARVEAVAVWRRAIVGDVVTDAEGNIVEVKRWPDWKAAMAWLERVDPATWGRRWAPDTPQEGEEPEEALDALVERAESIVRDHAARIADDG